MDKVERTGGAKPADVDGGRWVFFPDRPETETPGEALAGTVRRMTEVVSETEAAGGGAGGGGTAPLWDEPELDADWEDPAGGGGDEPQDWLRWRYSRLPGLCAACAPVPGTADGAGNGGLIAFLEVRRLKERRALAELTVTGGEHGRVKQRVFSLECGNFDMCVRLARGAARAWNAHRLRKKAGRQRRKGGAE